MKKYLGICIIFAAVAALTGCDSGGGSKQLLGTTTAGGQVVATVSAFTTAQQTVFTEQLFYAAIAGHNHKTTSLSTYSIVYTYPGPLNGSISLSGSGTYYISSSLYTWTLSSMVETLNSYSFQYNGINYVMTGTINVSGTMTTSGTGAVFVSPSTLSFSGTFNASGGGISQNVTVSVTVVPNSTGTGGSMSGTIGGLVVSQSF